MGLVSVENDDVKHETEIEDSFDDDGHGEGGGDEDRTTVEAGKTCRNKDEELWKSKRATVFRAEITEDSKMKNGEKIANLQGSEEENEVDMLQLVKETTDLMESDFLEKNEEVTLNKSIETKEEKILEALHLISTGMPIRAAARVYGLAEGSLRYRLRRIKDGVPVKKHVGLSPEEEDLICDHCELMSRKGNKLCISEVISLAKRMVELKGWNLLRVPNNDWYWYLSTKKKPQLKNFVVKFKPTVKDKTRENYHQQESPHDPKTVNAAVEKELDKFNLTLLQKSFRSIKNGFLLKALHLSCGSVTSAQEKIENCLGYFIDSQRFSEQMGVLSLMEENVKDKTSSTLNEFPIFCQTEWLVQPPKDIVDRDQGTSQSVDKVEELVSGGDLRPEMSSTALHKSSSNSMKHSSVSKKSSSLKKARLDCDPKKRSSVEKTRVNWDSENRSSVKKAKLSCDVGKSSPVDKVSVGSDLDEMSSGCTRCASLCAQLGKIGETYVFQIRKLNAAHIAENEAYDAEKMAHHAEIQYLKAENFRLQMALGSLSNITSLTSNNRSNSCSSRHTKHVSSEKIFKKNCSNVVKEESDSEDDKPMCDFYIHGNS